MSQTDCALPTGYPGSSYAGGSRAAGAVILGRLGAVLGPAAGGLTEGEGGRA